MLMLPVPRKTEWVIQLLVDTKRKQNTLLGNSFLKKKKKKSLLSLSHSLSYTHGHQYMQKKIIFLFHIFFCECEWRERATIFCCCWRVTPQLQPKYDISLLRHIILHPSFLSTHILMHIHYEHICFVRSIYHPCVVQFMRRPSYICVVVVVESSECVCYFYLFPRVHVVHWWK